MKTGALIVAAGMSSRMKTFKPMLKIGSITFIHRIILTFEQAGVSPIVIVTGNQSELIEEHVSCMNVACLKNKEYEHSQMFDSVKIGLNYLQDKCDQILFTPVDVPLFTHNTVKRLMNGDLGFKSPVYKRKKGHPVCIPTAQVPTILAYEGNQGLKGAILETKTAIVLVEVEDEGILIDADTKEDFEELQRLYLSKGV